MTQRWRRTAVFVAAIVVAGASVAAVTVFVDLGVDRYGGTIRVAEAGGTVDVAPQQSDGAGDDGPTSPTPDIVAAPTGGGGGGGGDLDASAGDGDGGGGGGNDSDDGDGDDGGGSEPAPGCEPADGDGLTLAPGDAGTTVREDAGGNLTIDFDVAGAGLGANVAAIYLVGDPDDQPAGEHAFSITNNFDDPADIAVNYSATSAAVVDGEHNVVVDVFATDGTHLTWTSEETGPGVVTGLAAGDVLCATVTVDTRSLDPSHDLSGDLNVTASPA